MHDRFHGQIIIKLANFIAFQELTQKHIKYNQKCLLSGGEKKIFSIFFFFFSLAAITALASSACDLVLKVHRPLFTEYQWGTAEELCCWNPDWFAPLPRAAKSHSKDNLWWHLHKPKLLFWNMMSEILAKKKKLSRISVILMGLNMIEM